MKVYSVENEWTNDDGWGISSPHTMASFTDETKAREYIYRETGKQTALDHGFADVTLPNGTMDRWRIKTLDVKENE